MLTRLLLTSLTALTLTSCLVSANEEEDREFERFLSRTDRGVEPVPGQQDAAEPDGPCSMSEQQKCGEPALFSCTRVNGTPKCACQLGFSGPRCT